MARQHARYLKDLSAEDQADVLLSGWFKHVTSTMRSCCSRVNSYHNSDEESGHVLKLLGEINMVIGLLLLARSELVRLHRLDGFPHPTMDDKAMWEEERPKG